MARPKRPKPLYVGGTVTEKLNTAAFGPIAASPTFGKAACWLDQLTKPHLTEPEKLWLIEEVQRAYIEGEDGFFLALGFLTRNKHEGVKDRLRYGLIYSFLGLWGQKLEKTRNEVLDELEALGFNLDERHLRRLFTQLGVKFKRGRIGRPPKKS